MNIAIIPLFNRMIILGLALSLFPACESFNAKEKDSSGPKNTPEQKEPKKQENGTPPPKTSKSPKITLDEVLSKAYEMIGQNSDAVADSFREKSEAFAQDRSQAKTLLETSYKGLNLLAIAVQSPKIERIRPELNRLLKLVASADAKKAVNQKIGASSLLQVALDNLLGKDTILLFKNFGADESQLNNEQLGTYFRSLCSADALQTITEERLKTWLAWAFDNKSSSSVQCVLNNSTDRLSLERSLFKDATKSLETAVLAESAISQITSNETFNNFMQLLISNYGVSQIFKAPNNILAEFVELLNGPYFKDPKIQTLLSLVSDKIKELKFNGTIAWPEFVEPAHRIAGTKGLSGPESQALLALPIDADFLIRAVNSNLESSKLKEFFDLYLQKNRRGMESLAKATKDAKKFLTSLAWRKQDADTVAIFQLAAEKLKDEPKLLNRGESDDETPLDILVDRNDGHKAIVLLLLGKGELKKPLNAARLKVILSAFYQNKVALGSIVQRFVSLKLLPAAIEWSDELDRDEKKAFLNLIAAQPFIDELLQDLPDQEKFLQLSAQIIRNNYMANIALSDANYLKRLLQKDPDLYLRAELRRVFAMASPDVVRDVLNHQIDNDYPIEILIREGNKEGIKLLLEYGAGATLERLSRRSLENLIALHSDDETISKELFTELSRANKFKGLISSFLLHNPKRLMALYKTVEPQSQARLLGDILSVIVEQTVSRDLSVFYTLNEILNLIGADSEVILADGTKKNILTALVALLGTNLSKPNAIKALKNAIDQLFRANPKDWQAFIADASKPMAQALGSTFEAQRLLYDVKGLANSLIEAASDQSISNEKLEGMFMPHYNLSPDLLAGGFLNSLAKRTIDEFILKILRRLLINIPKTADATKSALNEALPFYLRAPQNSAEERFLNESIDELVNASAQVDPKTGDEELGRLLKAVGFTGYKVLAMINARHDQDLRMINLAIANDAFGVLGNYLQAYRSEDKAFKETLDNAIFKHILETDVQGLKDWLKDDKKWNFGLNIYGHFYSLDNKTTGSMAYWLAKKLNLSDAEERNRLKAIFSILKGKTVRENFKDYYTNPFKWQSYISTPGSDGETPEELLIKSGIEKATAQTILHNTLPGAGAMKPEEQLILAASDLNLKNDYILYLLRGYLDIFKPLSLIEAEHDGKKFLSEIANRPIDKEGSIIQIFQLLKDYLEKEKNILNLLLKDRSAFNDDEQNFIRVLQIVVRQLGVEPLNVDIKDTALESLLDAMKKEDFSLDQYRILLEQYGKTPAMLTSAASKISGMGDEDALDALAQYEEKLKASSDLSLVAAIEQGLLARLGGGRGSETLLATLLKKFKLPQLFTENLVIGDKVGTVLLLSLQNSTDDYGSQWAKQALKEFATGLKKKSASRGIAWNSYSQSAYDYLVNAKKVPESTAQELLVRD